MRLLNGLTLKGKYLIALDWSRTEVCVYDGRTDTTETFKTIEDVARKHPGCSLVLEATAESFELERRKKVLDALEEANIDAYVSDTLHEGLSTEEQHSEERRSGRQGDLPCSNGEQFVFASIWRVAWW